MDMLDSASITHKFHLSTRVSVAGSDVRRTPMAVEVEPTMATSTMRRSGKKNNDEYVVSPERLHRARTSAAAAAAHRQQSAGPPTSSSLLRETPHLHGGAEEGPTYIEQQESDSTRLESPMSLMGILIM